MSPSQRKTYFGTLWPDVCRAQGWNVKDEERRRDVTFAATGQESTSKLNQDQITLLWIKLKWLADPANFDKAYADANPEIALAEHKRQNVIWRIEKAAQAKGLNEAYLTKVAEYKVARHRVKSWRDFPLHELVNFSKTIAARKKHAAPVQDSCTEAAKDDNIPF
ncbi:hypothetical protein [Prosthecobacter vanneervenii]|uniref:Uncharacterized protein n=1 Tax=Prosthecobacter vanneervenii TaxID=48466 RepID=A0A7W7YBU6_9BACT|nr:hypothetical protein [Prosthecobacter vanneervenii]MBB5033132.1 hypothetical protein [Prosthecobacter vanneervenii]